MKLILGLLIIITGVRSVFSQQSELSDTQIQLLDHRIVGIHDSHEHGGNLADGRKKFEKLYTNQSNINKIEASRFVENKGQWDPKVLYRAELIDGYIYFEKDGLTYHFFNGNQYYESVHGGAENQSIANHAFKMSFAGASTSSKVHSSGVNPKQHSLSYFINNEKVNDIKMYQKLVYQNIYPGIDVAYSSYLDHLKYDIFVAPNANSTSIVMNYAGADRVFVVNGNLAVETSLGGIVEYQPYAFQLVNGQQKEVICNFKVNGNKVSFDFPNGYDHSKELIIDPTLVASTYTGSTSDNWGFTAAHDKDGRMYVAGITNGTGYPVSLGAFDATYNGGTNSAASGMASDVTVSIFSADGTTLIASTYLGGSGDETPHSLVVDPAGNVYILGKTRSTNFPTSGTAYDATHNGGGEDIFVTCLSPNLSSLIGSTYIGGSGIDGANISANFTGIGNTRFTYGDAHRGQLVLDGSGNVYVTSSTRSSNFPTTAGAYDVTLGGSQDAVVFKMNPTLSTLLYSTYLGGSSNESGVGLELDMTNRVYVVGATESTNYPVTAGAFRTTFGGSVDGFVSLLNASGTGLIASTYLGTANSDGAFYVQKDNNGNIHVYGLSLGGAYPVSPGVYSNANTCQFLQGLNPLLTASNYSTTFGNGSTQPNISPTGFEVDSCGKIIVAGWARAFDGGSCTGMATTPGAFQTTTDGKDFYFMVLLPDATGLLYATFFGESVGIGDHVDGGTSTFDDKGIIYQAVCASCGGTNGFPVTPGAASTTNNAANCNNGVLKFNLDTYAPNAAAISAAPVGCVNIAVPFTNNSGGATSYLWDFGDGSPTSTAVSPTHVYASAGTYTVQLIAYNPTACITSDTTSVSLTINAPVVNVSVTPIGGNICNGTSATLTANGASTYLWTPTNATTSAITVSPSATTSYKVVGTDAAGCKDSVTTLITVTPTTTVANANIDQFACSSSGTTTLAGNNPTSGTGLWTQISGPNTAVFGNNTVYNSTLSGLSAGTYVFQWTISNSPCSSSMDQVSVTVNPPPSASNAGADQTICPATSIGLSANTPTIGSGLWTLVSGPNTPTITSNTSASTTVTGMVAGTYLFRWSISNSGCTPSTDDVQVIIQSNCPPTSVNETITTNEDVAFTGTNGTNGILDNGDSDPDGNTLSVSGVIDGPNNGTFTFSSNGSYTYTPSSNFNGNDTVVVSVCDNGMPSSCVNDTLFITVVPANDAPTTTDVTVLTVVDAPIGVNVGSGTSDPENNPLTYTYGTPSDPGATVSVTGNGTIVVTPPTGFVGTITVPFIVCDSSEFAVNVLCTTGTITVEVIDTTGGVNNPPVANPDLVTSLVDVPVTVNPIGNDFDVDGDDLTVSLNPLDEPNNGTAVLNPDGTVTYTPNVGFTGTDTISYVICDAGTPALCDTSEIIVTISPVVDEPNVAPIATDDYGTTPEDTPITVSITNNDTDPNGTPLNPPTVFTNGTNGTAVINPDGTLTYTPNPNFNGNDTITYVICDAAMPSLCDTAEVIITVVPANDAPTTTDVTVLTPIDTPIGVNVGTGTSDPENNPLTYTYGTPSEPGVTVSVTGNGTIVVTPPTGFVGTITVPFTVCDSSEFAVNVLCTTGTITVEVIDTTGGVNNPPVANVDLTTTPVNVPVTVNPLGNDFDVDGDDLTVSLDPLGAPSNGTAVLNPDGTVTYTPNAGFTGNDTISYVICDAGTPALCDTSEIIVTISPVVDEPNVAPIATDDYESTYEDTPVTVSVLNNDSDPNGNPLSNPSIFDDPSNGTVEVNADGTITYTPNPGFNGVDTFTYVVCDTGSPAQCDTADVIITVIPCLSNPSFDCDGDGVTNGDEVNPPNGGTPTDPSVPCDYISADQSLAPSLEWLALDCDGDGVTNGDELNPPNGGTPTDPENPCDYVSTNHTITPSQAWMELDCDGDGVTNGDEVNPPNGGTPTNPLNPCDLIVTNQTVPPSVEWLSADCDNDGITNGDEVTNGSNPLDPCSPKPCTIEVPEALTPDGDGVNDFFVIPGIEYYPNNSLIIFNRWGNIVYEVEKYNNDWRGTTNSNLKFIGGGEDLPTGTYYYVLDANNPEKDVYKGFIYIQR